MLKLVLKAESSGNGAVAKEAKKLMEEHLLNDNCEYAAASRAVNNDPEAFGI